MKRLAALLLVFTLLFTTGCGEVLSNPYLSADNEERNSSDLVLEAAAIDEDGIYDSKDEVALYIHTYGHLPSNYITKKSL